MREPSSEKAKKYTTWAMVLFPLGLALVLLVINPEYGSELIRLEQPYAVYPYLPCGWLVVLVALSLTGMALISNLLIDHYVQKRWLGFLFKIAVFLLLTLPTLFLLLLGPAGFHILRSGALDSLGN